MIEASTDTAALGLMQTGPWTMHVEHVDFDGTVRYEIDYEGVMVGHAELLIGAKSVHLSGLYLGKHCRRGFARLWIEHLKAHLTRAGYERITLLAVEDGRLAWQCVGFSEVASQDWKLNLDVVADVISWEIEAGRAHTSDLKRWNRRRRTIEEAGSGATTDLLAYEITPGRCVCDSPFLAEAEWGHLLAWRGELCLQRSRPSVHLPIHTP